ncbi:MULTISPECIES: serine hydrolase [Corallococcus]|nr:MULTISPECIES: serine hydrolase domain-containing protein [Corallococcus]
MTAAASRRVRPQEWIAVDPGVMKTVWMITQADVQRGWQRLCEYTEHARIATGVPGVAIAIAWLPEQGPPLVETLGAGCRLLGSQAPAADNQVTADTVFPLASLSKPLASTVMTTLIPGTSDGWEEKVPSLGLAVTPTFASLFAHRSGLPDHAGDLLEDMGHDRKAVLERLRLLALDRTGGYAYTNFGLTAAACQAALHVGKEWEDVAHDRLYAPLGMKSTSSRYSDFLKRENRTWAHRLRANGEWYHAKPLPDGKPNPDAQRNPDAQSPAGGVTSSANDMALWLRLQLGDLGLGFDAEFFRWLSLTHRPYVPGIYKPGVPREPHTSGYGLGWNVTDREGQPLKYSHSGAFGLGAATSVELWPEDRLGVVVLTNGEPVGVAEALCAAFRGFVSDPGLEVAALLKPDFDSFVHPGHKKTFVERFQEAMRQELHPPARASDTANPARVISAKYGLLGKYQSAFYGTIEFRVEQDRMFMLQGPAKQRFDVTATHKDDVFVYDSHGENGTDNNRIAFDRATPNQVTVWNLFVSTPLTLKSEGDTLCPVPGEIRAWRVRASKPGQVRLTLARRGVDGFRQSPLMTVAVGDNRFVGADLPVLEGDMLGFSVDDRVYWQHSTDDYVIEADIDREGTFTRVP